MPIRKIINVDTYPIFRIRLPDSTKYMIFRGFEGRKGGFGFVIAGWDYYIVRGL
jgi:hypothetical protein